MSERVRGTEQGNTVLILYPWGIDTVIEKSMGAGLRVGLLSEFLREQGYAVTVASVGMRFRELFRDGITFIEYRYPSSSVLFLLYGATLTFAKAAGIQSLRAWLYFTFPRRDKAFAAAIRSLSEAYACVLLEYPFWQAALDRKDAILTNHDVISLSWAGPSLGPLGRALRNAILREELAAMRGCRSTVVVSESDREFFRSQGAGDPCVIENPVRLPKSGMQSTAGAVDHRSAGRSKAVFIGGGWFPNARAARSIAYDIAPRCPQIDFILAGECTRGIRRTAGNVTCIRTVSASALADFYRDATYAVIPLQEGTGTSLKTIEALAYGKVVVASSIGVRGIPFEDGVHGVLCESSERIADVLRALDNEPDTRARMSRHAVKLAQRYDYRVIFRKYLDLLQHSGIGRNGAHLDQGGLS